MFHVMKCLYINRFRIKSETLKHDKSYHLRKDKQQFVEHNVVCKIFAKLLLIVNLLSNK